MRFKAGSINGKEYLTIHIASFVGPASCHGSVLRVSSGPQESIALEAMLKSEKVVLTVPVSRGECVDGLPTVTKIGLAPRIY